MSEGTVPVTQADREAAIKALNEAERQRSFGGNGTVLSNVCRIIATHRIAAEHETVARIVAWLREQDGYGEWYDVADAIEAGEWK